ncbi:MAG: hypothetical protein GXP55_18720 [Deltaproteobacteria bacterium]|nr:hypothetical protein [Deltaproteobacteria bacterium]
MPPTLVGSDYGIVSADIVLGRSGGGLVIYDACPPEGEQCTFGGGGEYETRRVPQLRAFDADGILGPVQYLDAPGSINEPLFGSAAGDGFLVVVANSLVQSVSATGELLGPPIPSPFSTQVFAGFPVEPDAALFVLDPREDGSVWLATLDASGRPRGEVRSDIRFELPRYFLGMASSANRERIVLATAYGLYGMTRQGELNWTRETVASYQWPIVVGDNGFMLLRRGLQGPRHWELLRLGDMGAVEESIDLGDLAFNRDDIQGLTGAVSTGDGLLLFEHVRRPYGDPDRDPHINVYPMRCLPPPAAGDAG